MIKAFILGKISFKPELREHKDKQYCSLIYKIPKKIKMALGKIIQLMQ